MNIETPDNWRKGQTIFNFLAWLQSTKGYGNLEGGRMADPFHIPDEKMDKLWSEYLEETK